MASSAEAAPARLTLRGALLGLGICVALAYGIVSVAVEDRTPLRMLGVADCWFDVAKVDPGQTVTSERTWQPGRVVYVVGWNPVLSVAEEAAYEAELSLFERSRGTRIFVMLQNRSPPADASFWSPAQLPEGTGYRLGADATLTLRLRITNTGAVDFCTRGVGAQIRFVPAGREGGG